MKKPYTMHILSHTHWDREWYQTFQGYRRRLVYQIDAMMDLLEKRRAYPCFHLDGQTSVLSDYVQIRPEGRARLQRLIQKGRVEVGPWFTQPDEAHVSGESLVRNLLLGHRHCAEWKVSPMPIGWISDVFSHVSQMPQILAGFDLDCAFMHHGTPCTEDEKSEMAWTGADGTTLLMLKAFPPFGYQDFWQMRCRSKEDIRSYEQDKIRLASTNVMFGMDGNDHEPAKWNTPEVIARANTLFAQTRLVHSTMRRYLAALKKALGPNWMKDRPHFSGELRAVVKSGRWNGVCTGTGSSRLPLKQANDHVEYLLARQAEPFHAWATALGDQPQKSYIDLAWQYLMLNHPHDSICGCSIDQPHRDMAYRFDQARLLGQDSLDDAMQVVAHRMDVAKLGGGDAVATVFNPGTQATGPVTAFAFEVPQQQMDEMRAKKLAPVLLDARGAELRAQTLRVEEKVRATPFMYRDAGATVAMYRRDFAVTRFHLAAEAAVPALGYRSWRIAFRPEKSTPVSKPAAVKPVTVNAKTGMLDNGLIRLSVRPDGRVDLTDKALGVSFKGLHAFEDGGDAGEGWNHVYPAKDMVVSSLNARSRGRVSVSVTEQGPMRATVKVALSLRIPAGLVQTVKGKWKVTDASRTRETVILPIESTFTVTAGSRRVDCVTTVNNTADCHRLRVLFPTGRKTATWQSDSAFDIVNRPVHLKPTPASWAERQRPETPIKNFAAMSDRQAGLAILTKGLYEAAVNDTPDRTIILTLFRSFIEYLTNETTQDSTLRGPLTMEYAMLPFKPENGHVPPAIMGEVDVYKLAPSSYSRPCDGRPVTRSPLPPYSAEPLNLEPSMEDALIPLSPALKQIMDARPPQPHDLAPDGALMELGAPLALSTIKQSEDGLSTIVRIWNPSERAASALFRSRIPFRHAVEANLNETAQSPLRMGKDGKIRLRLKPKQIMTLRLTR